MGLEHRPVQHIVAPCIVLGLRGSQARFGYYLPQSATTA